MPDLSDTTMFISGASRGIGLAIATRAARDGANVALIAKTADPHHKLEGTVYTAAEASEDLRKAISASSAVPSSDVKLGSIGFCTRGR